MYLTHCVKKSLPSFGTAKVYGPANDWPNVARKNRKILRDIVV